MINKKKVLVGTMSILGFSIIFISAYINISQYKTFIAPQITSQNSLIQKETTNTTSPLSPQDVTANIVDITKNELIYQSSYTTPKGVEPILVRVEINEDRTVKQLEVSFEGLDQASKRHQEIFNRAFDSIQFEGSPIEDVEIDKVANASATSEAFNKAIEELSDQNQTSNND